jgi:hypothetical protein
VTDADRRRLLSGVRVTILIFEEIRLAQKDGRGHDPSMMHAAASWAAEALREVVGDYYERRRRRLGYR